MLSLLRRVSPLTQRRLRPLFRKLFLWGGPSTPLQARKPLSFLLLKLSYPPENAPDLNGLKQPTLSCKEAEAHSPTTRFPTPDIFQLESVVRVKKKSYVELKTENQTLQLQCAQFMDTISDLQEDIIALKAHITSTKKKKPEKKKPDRTPSAEKTGPLETSLKMESPSPSEATPPLEHLKDSEPPVPDKNSNKGALKRKIYAPKAVSSAKLSWAEIAVKPAMDTISEQTKAKNAQTKKDLIDAQFSCPQQKPRPSLLTVYFVNVPRGPLGALRKALFLSLPMWAVISLFFIGNNILEVICQPLLVIRLVSTMAILRHRHLYSYEPTGSKSNAANKEVRAKSCYRRRNWCALHSRSPAAKSWYCRQAQGLKDSHQSLELDSPASSIRSEAHDASYGTQPPQPEPGSQENSPSNDISPARPGGSDQ